MPVPAPQTYIGAVAFCFRAKRDPLKKIVDFDLKSEAIIWAWLTDMWHIRSIAVVGGMKSTSTLNPKP